MVKQIPNMLSLSRIFLGISLLFLTKRPVLFVLAYLTCGITDVLDGFLARRYHWDSKLGAKLDGIGDNTFMLSAIICVFVIMKLVRFERYLIIGISILISFRIINLLLTKIKFKQWNALHTTANKLIGVPLFFSVPICVLNNAMPKSVVLFLIGGGYLISLEETTILLRLKEYQVNVKSIFYVKNGTYTLAEKNDAA